MSLIFTLAARNLFHDRLRFIATLIGIVFSMILVTVQMGLYLGFGRMVTTALEKCRVASGNRRQLTVGRVR